MESESESAMDHYFYAILILTDENILYLNGALIIQITVFSIVNIFVLSYNINYGITQR